MMRFNPLRGRFGAMVLGCALAGGFVAYPLANKPALADHEEHPHHPRIHRAIEALREARTELSEATHTYGGHKREAIESIDQAIRHLEAARDFDRDHR